jgi:hypothetical protein
MIGGWKQPEKPRSYGVVVLPLIKTNIKPANCQLDGGMPIVMQMESNGSMKTYNNYSRSWAQALEALKPIFGSRSHKSLYLIAEDDLHYSDYISFVADAKADTPGLAVIMLTRDSMRLQAHSDMCSYGYLGQPPDSPQLKYFSSGSPL